MKALIPAGLLLNNLSVYHGCEIVFDSSEVPEQAMAAATQVADVQVCRALLNVASCLLGYLTSFGADIFVHMLPSRKSTALLPQYACQTAALVL